MLPNTCFNAIREVLNTEFLKTKSHANKVCSRPKKAGIIRSADTTPVEMSIDILEWLESERLEHENRMQGLGCGSELREKLPEPRDESKLNKSSASK
jgi:hypothetical protein